MTVSLGVLALQGYGGSPETISELQCVVLDVVGTFWVVWLESTGYKFVLCVLYVYIFLKSLFGLLYFKSF